MENGEKISQSIITHIYSSRTIPHLPIRVQVCHKKQTLGSICIRAKGHWQPNQVRLYLKEATSQKEKEKVEKI